MRRFRTSRRRGLRRSGRYRKLNIAKRRRFRRRSGRSGRRRYVGRRRRYGRRGRRNRRFSRRSSRKTRRSRKNVSQLYERVESKACNTTPGQQHFRDFTVGGIPSQLGFIFNQAMVKLGHMNSQRSFAARVPATPITAYTEDDLSVMNPDLFRVKFRESAEFTCYNTGTTTAYITVTRLVRRHTLKMSPVAPTTSSEFDTLIRIPNTAQPNPVSGLTNPYGVSYFPPAVLRDITTNPNQVTVSTFWNMGLNIFGPAIVEAYGLNNQALRQWHASQQFEPYTVRKTDMRIDQLNLYNWYANTITPGTYNMNSQPSVPTLTTNAVRHERASTELSRNEPIDESRILTDDNYTNAFGTGPSFDSYAVMPQYDERRKGPFDQIFKRKHRRIVLHPGQSYSFKETCGSAVMSADGPYGMRCRSWYDNSQTNPQDSPYGEWHNNGNLYPRMTCAAYGCDYRGVKPSRFVSFCIRGNTQIDNKTADSLTEAGPAAVIIKRRYQCHYTPFMKKQRMLRWNPPLYINKTSASVDPLDFSQMFPTSAPIVAPFSKVS